MNREDAALPPRSASGKGKKRPRPKKSRKPRRALRWLFGLFAIVILALSGYVVHLFLQADNLLDKVASQEVTEVPKEERAQVKPLSLLLLGSDYRRKTGSMNTDVMMVATLNPQTKTATVVSIPRDSYLEVKGFTKRKANGWYARYYQLARSEKKLEGEAAHADARRETREFVSEFFGFPIDYTAVIDFQGFVEVVDALGGIDVYVDQDMRYIDNADGTNINLKKGQQVLDGDQALDFVRYRQSNDGTRQSSDFERNDRQSRVLGAIVDKLKSLGAVTKIDDILEAVGDNLRTDIPKSQIRNMIATYFGISKADIRFIPLEGEWRSPYVYLDETRLEEAKRALREELQPDGRPSPPPAGSPDASPAAAQ